MGGGGEKVVGKKRELKKRCYLYSINMSLDLQPGDEGYWSQQIHRGNFTFDVVGFIRAKFYDATSNLRDDPSFQKLSQQFSSGDRPGKAWFTLYKEVKIADIKDILPTWLAKSMLSLWLLLRVLREVLKHLMKW